MDGAAVAGEALLQLSAFERWLLMPGEWVEPVNIKRGGVSGVLRIRQASGQTLYAKQQTGYACRSLRHPLGEPTILREFRAIRAVAALGIGVPRVVYCGVREVDGRQDALLVTAGLEGFSSLKDWYASGRRQQWSGELKARIFRQLGRQLARLHAARWQHGALYDNHIFLAVRPEGPQLVLLDLEKSRRRLCARLARRHDLDKLHRHSAWGVEEWQCLEEGYRAFRQQPGDWPARPLAAGRQQPECCRSRSLHEETGYLPPDD